MRTRLLTTLTVLALALSAGAATRAALAATPRASFTDVESDVMCVSCRELLAVAQSPQSYAERDLIRRLIARGLTKRQIEAALVGQYGEAVLAKPPADGFNLTVYVLPPAVLLAGIAILVVVLPRWRRARSPGREGPAPELAEDDARRLDRELAAFKG